ncbi:hypothetical protein T932_02746, partial [Staphylococcus aureus FVRH6035]
PPVLFKIRHLNNITGVFYCQIFLSRTKTRLNAVISTVTAVYIKSSYFYIVSSYFYIVSRQEETRFTRFKNPHDF